MEDDKYEAKFEATKTVWIYLWLHCNEEWESLWNWRTISYCTLCGAIQEQVLITFSGTRRRRDRVLPTATPT